MELVKKSFAEIVGTAVLVIFGCGVAIVSGEDSVAVALAFGLAIVAMAYSIGNVSGCHVNPAVSLAMLIRKKITFKEFIVYVVSQLIGAAIGCLFLLMIFGKDCGFGANLIQGRIVTTFDSSKIMQYLAALIGEIVLTFTFVLAILGVTSKKEHSAVSGIVIGLTLTLVHLLGLFITGTSVNPARSLMPALFALFTGKTALIQVWIFIVGPFVGAILAALFHQALECVVEKKAAAVATAEEPKTEVVAAKVETKVETIEAKKPVARKKTSETKTAEKPKTTRKTTKTK